jgi:hypothetical protein
MYKVAGQTLNLSEQTLNQAFCADTPDKTRFQAGLLTIRGIYCG